ncbi:hypothetical protein KEM54_001936 [Ascosphaera aggregata]|nr:hypothetical protein KEM54_001936 [Ascosphaera aggregata]
MSLDGRSLRSKAVDLLNSLDFSWQHVTYKTLASVWVLFVFYLSWLLLPEVCAILHGCGNANGTGFGTAQRTLPDLEIVPSFAAQAAVPFHPSPTHLSVIRDGAFAGATSISEYVGFSVVGTPSILITPGTCLASDLLGRPELKDSESHMQLLREGHGSINTNGS